MSANQHSIDLLPDAIRQRSQAGVRMGQFVVVAVASLAALVIASTHSRLLLRSMQQQYQAATTESNQVFATEARAEELRRVLEETKSFTDLYDRVALPLDVSAVAASIINVLPESVTLDQMDLDAVARVTNRSPRSKGVESKEPAPPRVLTGEISGFAASDTHIAELVSKLESMPPFRDVNLDFSRTRRVNEIDAREFRLSFKIDLDTPYVAIDRTADAAKAGEAADVQR